MLSRNKNIIVDQFSIVLDLANKLGIIDPKNWRKSGDQFSAFCYNTGTTKSNEDEQRLYNLLHQDVSPEISLAFRLQTYIQQEGYSVIPRELIEGFMHYLVKNRLAGEYKKFITLDAYFAAQDEVEKASKSTASFFINKLFSPGLSQKSDFLAIDRIIMRFAEINHARCSYFGKV